MDQSHYLAPSVNYNLFLYRTNKHSGDFLNLCKMKALLTELLMQENLQNLEDCCSLNTVNEALHQLESNKKLKHQIRRMQKLSDEGVVIERPILIAKRMICQLESNEKPKQQIQRLEILNDQGVVSERPIIKAKRMIS